MLLMTACTKDDDLEQQGGKRYDSITRITPHLFSVSDTTQVTFSKGNLQYNASSDTWRFAEHQWEYIGDDNTNIGKDEYTGWIDLFCWGTGDEPTKHTTETADYTTFNDWGENLKLIDMLGENWRTLNKDEWYYLINNREGKCGLATVCNIKGIVLLPDEWTCPSGLSFVADYGKSTKITSPTVIVGPRVMPGTNYRIVWTISNNYNEEQWARMEDNGAIFLPAAGRLENSNTQKVGDNGHYWSSTTYNTDNAFDVYYTLGEMHANDNKSRSNGLSVRLVRQNVPQSQSSFE